MAVRLKPLRDQVIVITGASSGIGLETAREAAAKGARVVLAARNGEALAEVERSITAAGGQAAHVAADVSSQEDVRRIAETAVSRFGGFDTWVNNAGVSIWGRLDLVTDEDNRRLFDTNFWGTVYGSLTAAEHLRRRGGAIVNVGSVASDLSIPIQGMYSASKHAVKGFTDALRMELEQERAPVSVTLIKPTSIDTPLPQNARNYTGREPKLPDPVYAPREVAYAILHAATRGGRDIYVGGAGRALSALHSVAPRTADWVGEGVLAPQELRDEPARPGPKNLHRPGPGGRVRGEHPGYVRKTSYSTRASLNPVLTGVLFATAGVAIGALVSGAGSASRHPG